jgi:hypothetical protein
MHKHLFVLKKVCPATHQDIDLTDEIKQYILNNRVYHSPKQTQQQVIIQQINNNQQIINYIAKLDTRSKLDTFLEHTQTNLLPFEVQIEEQYKEQIDKCDDIETRLESFSIKTPDILEILNTLTSSTNADTLNVIYDKTPNKLSIYGDGEWDTCVFEQGVKKLIDKVREGFLDDYELLLLNKLDTDPFARERQRAKEHLQEYYRFLESFETNPIILEYNRLVGEKQDIVHDFNEKYYGMYDNIKKNMKLAKAKELRKDVYNMIKNNCNASVNDLNKKMMDIICTDEEFKSKVMQTLCSS